MLTLLENSCYDGRMPHIEPKPHRSVKHKTLFFSSGLITLETEKHSFFSIAFFFTLVHFFKTARNLRNSGKIMKQRKETSQNMSKLFRDTKKSRLHRWVFNFIPFSNPISCHCIIPSNIHEEKRKNLGGANRSPVTSCFIPPQTSSIYLPQSL